MLCNPSPELNFLAEEILNTLNREDAANRVKQYRENGSLRERTTARRVRQDRILGVHPMSIIYQGAGKK